MTIEPGELVVLIGPSGCGKTTLLKLINRLYDPTSGVIYIDGTPSQQLDRARPAPSHGLRHPAGRALPALHRRGERGRRAPVCWAGTKRVPAIGWTSCCELVGLPPEEYRSRYPSQLSGGQQQRVGIARAIAAGPGTLLMDEPFGALDAITRARLQEELRELHERLGQTIVFVTHDIDEAALLADRIAVMREGEVVQYDTPLNVIMQPADRVRRRAGRCGRSPAPVESGQRRHRHDCTPARRCGRSR